MLLVGRAPRGGGGRSTMIMQPFLLVSEVVLVVASWQLAVACFFSLPRILQQVVAARRAGPAARPQLPSCVVLPHRTLLLAPSDSVILKRIRKN